MVNFALWVISPRGRQEWERRGRCQWWWWKEWKRVRSNNDVIGGEGGWLGWSGSGGPSYGTDVVIGSLRRGTRSRIRVRVEDG